MNPNPYIDEDLQALAETVRRFAQERVAPGFQERDQTRVLDRALLREMGSLGFICPELPEQFGGLGLGCLAAFRLSARAPDRPRRLRAGLAGRPLVGCLRPGAG